MRQIAAIVFCRGLCVVQPPLDPCFFDTFETLNATTGLPVINVSEAEKVSQAENINGADEEIYDFFLMLKSDLMKGWPLPSNILKPLGRAIAVISWRCTLCGLR